jgi:hypothetical protein
MFKKLPLFIAVFLVSSCAYTMDESNQPLTVLTPGAQNSKCDVHVDGVRYVFYPPETRNIIKARKNIIVECMAPGNRDKKAVMPSKISNNTLLNGATGFVPGMVWDYASGAMFEYPSVVTVDFSTDPPNPMPPPAYENDDVFQPEMHGMESFAASQAKINSDQNKAPVQLIRRGQGSEYQDSEFGGAASSELSTPADSGDKGDLMKVIEKMGASINPAQTDTTEQVFPGQ